MPSQSTVRWTVLLTAMSLCISLSVWAQGTPTGALVGTVMDPSHAVIPGAAVQATDAATSTTYRTTTGATGHFMIGNLPPGTYTVTITAAGFRKAIFQDVKIIVGETYNLAATIQVGHVSTTVTVHAGQQLLHTTQTSIGTTVSGSAIRQVPSATNSALYGLTLMSPGIQTIGGPRQSSADGLPGGSVNITFDGIPAQWQTGKSGDPLFAMVSPNIDDVSQFRISTAAGSANNTGQGAVQINYVSKRGTNKFHGGVWEYFRNTALNANYYFNNLAGLPRQTMHYNQWGAKLGGPILKNKLFFFADFDDMNRPQGVTRTRTILTEAASKGLFTYSVNCQPGTSGCGVSSQPNPWTSCNPSALTCTANLMQMAGAFGGTSQVDKVIGTALGEINSAVTAPGVHQLAPPSPFQRTISFTNSGGYNMKMPDFRLDWNITQKNSFEFVYHLTRFVIDPGVLNNHDYTYPIAPFNTNQGGYFADRQIFAWAWRWNIGSSMSNQLRFGFQTSPSSVSPDLNLSVYPVAKTDLGTVRVQPVFPSGLVADPWLLTSESRNNAGVGVLRDNLVWAKGNHNLAFGFDVTRPFFHSANYAPQFARVSLGMVATDPLSGEFNSTNLPGISSADESTAAQLYGLLAGRVTNYSGSVAFDPSVRKFVTGQPARAQYHEMDYGLYATDSWRVRPNITFNYGLRWQYQGVPVDDLNEYFAVAQGYAGIYGVSGMNNLFKPGTLAGTVPSYVLDNGRSWYNGWYKGFAPSVGLAWEPEFHNSVWTKIFGSPGNSVFRAGYSIAYSREGLNNWSSIAGSNPGNSGQQFMTPVNPTGTIGPGEFAAGSVNLQSLNFPAVTQNPSRFESSIPINPSASNSVNVVDPNLHMPYVQSWEFSVQRSITPNMAFELDYIGNHAVGLWQKQNMNEVNIFENGFLKEFQGAEKNLAVCNANPTCSSAPSFADLGLSGQVPLPIFTAAFTGSTSDGPGSATQQNNDFSSGSFLTPLVNGQAGSVANTLTELSYWHNLMSAGYPSNFWVVNPNATGGSYLLRNGLQSTYNALVLQFRRRPSHGVMFDANYTLARGITDAWQRSGVNAFDFTTLRNPGLDKGPSPYDIRDAIKIDAIWQLPFGRGHRLSFSNRFLNKLISGWQFNSFTRWQTGRPTLLVGGLGGTFNQYDGGVTLHGMNWNQLQNSLGTYMTGTPAPGAVWYLPQKLLGAQGEKANASVLAGCSTAGQFCNRMFIYGPKFFDADWAIQKNTRITERVSWQFRAEFLNAFNNANFFYGPPSVIFYAPSANLQSNTFGRMTRAYQDLDTTDSPGGRIVQLVARINF